MNIILFDYNPFREALLPLTYTRPCANIRCGIFTINEKWENLTKKQISFATQPYLSKKFPTKYVKTNYYINGSIIPDIPLIETLKNLYENLVLMYKGVPIGFKSDQILDNEQINVVLNHLKKREYDLPITYISNTLEIFVQNGNQIRNDFEWIKSNKKSHSITDVHTRTYNIENIFVEEGVKLRAVVLNAEDGPIYLGKNSEIQEGAVIRGPFALGEQSIINMQAKIRPDVSIGPYCKVGGEVSNCVFYAYSNKGHDGFLGNSVVGEWCNIGADSNTSNLKNNYSEVKVWDYTTNTFENSGRMFCGTIMGDHVKCGINTMFNTGTTVGVNANIFGGGFPPKFIPSFSWGGGENDPKYNFEKVIEVAQKVMERRSISLSEMDYDILKWLYENAK
ncbi:MAG: GlmU family protein [Bacteroidota bacterium]|nr:GlmU family protein [Bacteroidota bacterium]